jgi:hypothetical protein
MGGPRDKEHQAETTDQRSKDNHYILSVDDSNGHGYRSGDQSVTNLQNVNS